MEVKCNSVIRDGWVLTSEKLQNLYMKKKTNFWHPSPKCLLLSGELLTAICGNFAHFESIWNLTPTLSVLHPKTPAFKLKIQNFARFTLVFYFHVSNWNSFLLKMT